MSGKILNSRYELDRELGGGGLGDTYLAFDLWKEGDNRCVVKQLKPGIVNATTLRLFEKEAEALSKLGSHNQIPTLWAHFQQDNQFYLVQQFIEGHDLTQEIKLGECWEETAVVKLLQDILEVLEFVHQNHVIHRDIKPGNIMRRQDGKIVLIDFGGVKQVKNNPASTQSSIVVGTPGYMPFEQIYNNAQLCSDIYAVGMLAIAALTGKNPVDIPINPDILQPIWRHQAQVSDRFADVINKMVKFHYTERYQTASELLKILQTILSTPLDWYKKGKELYKLQKYSEALTAFEQAIEIKKDFPEAWTFHGNILEDLGEFDNALVSYDRAIQIQYNYPLAWNNRGLVLTNLGRCEEALSSYDTAVAIQQNYPEAWVGRGLLLCMMERYSEALSSFDTAIQIKRDCFEAWTGGALVLYSVGNDKQATIAFDLANQIQSDIPEIWYCLGLVLNQQTRYIEAEACFGKAIEIKPDYAEALLGRGQACHYLGLDFSESLACFKQAIQIQPDSIDTLINHGTSLYESGRTNEAILFLDYATQIQPNNHQIWEKRGWCLHLMGRYSDAIVCYDHAIKLKRNNCKAWTNRGIALNALKKYGDAVEAYKQALKIDNNNFEAWLNLGLTQCEVLLYERAEVSFDNATKLQPNSFIAWLCRSVTLDKLGENKKAISSINKAIEIQPNEYFSLTVRGKILSNLKKYEEAISSLNQALTIQPDYNIAIEELNNVNIRLRRSTFSGRLKDARKIFMSRYKITWIGLSAFICAVFWNNIIHSSWGLIIIGIVILFLIIDFSIEIISPR